MCNRNTIENCRRKKVTITSTWRPQRQHHVNTSTYGYEAPRNYIAAAGSPAITSLARRHCGEAPRRCTQTLCPGAAPGRNASAQHRGNTTTAAAPPCNTVRRDATCFLVSVFVIPLDHAHLCKARYLQMRRSHSKPGLAIFNKSAFRQSPPGCPDPIPGRATIRRMCVAKVRRSSGATPLQSCRPG